MKKDIVLILICLLCAFQSSYAKANDKKEDKSKRVIMALTTIYKGDTIPSFELYEVTIYARQTFTNIRKQRKYDKLVRNVQKVYPISQDVKAILVETYLYLQTLPDEKSRQEHIESVEQGVWDQYLPIMKKLSLAQGKLLIKLIDRECNQTSFDLISAFMGGFRARFYQTFAALFGASLKNEYDPDGEDAAIEEIIYLIENDML